jgi:hypothetical protein
MANEATLVVRFSNPIDITVADGAGIEKGTILKLTDPRTGAASSADGDICIGVAAREKIANDGRTQLAVYIDGIFEMTTVASPAAIIAGHKVKLGGANLIDAADVTTAADFAEHLGTALETVTATVQETIQVRIGA